MENFKVSLLLVCYNAEKYVEKSLSSYLEQDIKKNNIEIIVIDGNSSDNTVNLCEKFLKDAQVSYKIIDNPSRTLASGWNLGIKNAKYNFVCRIDAHSTIPNDYISNLIKQYKQVDFNTINIGGIGGVLKNTYDSKFGEIASDFYSSKFGIGNSPFRVMSDIKHCISTDTAVFALYRKSLFDKVGFFNETLGRNQDIEFHKRVLNSGFKLYTDHSTIINYYVRSDYFSFLKKAYNDGYWVVKSNAYYIRHLIPLIFFIYMTIMIFALFFSDYNDIIFPFLVYCILAVFFAIKDGKKILSKLFLPPLYLTYHISYGYGSFIALIKKFFNLF